MHIFRFQWSKLVDNHRGNKDDANADTPTFWIGGGHWTNKHLHWTLLSFTTNCSASSIHHNPTIQSNLSASTSCPTTLYSTNYHRQLSTTDYLYYYLYYYYYFYHLYHCDFTFSSFTIQQMNFSKHFAIFTTEQGYNCGCVESTTKVTLYST